MSNLLFPSLPGLGWDIERTLVWQTRRQQAVSGKVTTIADWSAPMRKWQVSFEFLRSGTTHAELQSLAGLFNSLSGGFDTFLFSDPEDNAVTGQPIGVTDGVNGSFQLVRTYGGYTEAITAPNAVSSVTFNGNPFYAYNVDPGTGQLGLGEVQPAGYAIDVSFSYYWRCRISDDTLEFGNFMDNLHEVKQLTFESVK